MLVRYARGSLGALLLCAAALCAAGCHNNNNTSGFGVAWITLTDEPGDYTSYLVSVDSVTLTGKANGVITAVSAVETVDFTKLSDVSELWSSASIPNDTYTQATITLDYTNANISVLVNGLPVKATVVDVNGAAVTQISVTVNFDTPLVITPTFATTSAQRLALDLNLALSGYTTTSGNTATAVVRPYMTGAINAPDNKPIRVRGPLINSSVNVGTYTVEVRPFFDEIDSLGSLTLFNDANTIYTINGITYVGSSGLNVLSQLSAGTTMTAAYTSYQPTLTPSATAAKFNTLWVVAGSTLEDVYTEGMEGDVVARNGNNLTLRGATLFENTAQLVNYNDADSLVVLGPSTIVTADDNSSLTGLDYRSVSVGQHISVRGIYTLPTSNVPTLDATGSSSTNTGSVRIQSTQIWGQLTSAGAGSAALELQTINNWPASDFNFAGTGATAAQNASPADYLVNTGTIALPTGIVAGDPLWIDGFVSPFGSAPPDFIGFAVAGETSVPASLRALWTHFTGTITPFAGLSNGGFSINLSDPALLREELRIGPESIDLKSLPSSPLIVPQAAPTPPAGLPAVFTPLFALGNPIATTSSTGTPVGGVSEYSYFSDFVTHAKTAITTASPAYQFEARGLYNRATNTFTASSINVLL